MVGADAPEPDEAEPDDVRHQAARWLAENWDPGLSLAEWRRRLADSGWGCPTWPRAWYGRGATPEAAAAIAQEFMAAGAVGVAATTAVTLAAPTLLAHGSDYLRSLFLRPALVGSHRWTQLFSEPGSGSDLASVSTRAVLDRGTWVIDGRKVWSSGADVATHGMLIARTDWDVPKHRGITYFIVDLDQPGVEVRPIKQMNEHATFSAVTLSGVRVPASHVVGEVGGGWTVAATTLTSERSSPANLGAPVARLSGRCHREAAEEAERAARPYRWYPQRYGRPDLVRQSHSADPHVRQQIARVISQERIAEWYGARRHAAQRMGAGSGAESSLAKLMASELARACAVAHAQLAGARAMLGAAGAGDNVVAEILLSVPAVSLAGGTDEIQKNIIAEKVLGLPRDPSSDARLPFRDVRRDPVAEDR